MGLEQRWLDDDWQTSAAPRPKVRVKPRDGGTALDRRAVPLTTAELLPMAGILILVSLFTALLLLYLTSFARLSAQGSLDRQLQHRLGAVRQQNHRLEGEIAQLGRAERIEREAERLGLLPLAPQQTDRLSLGTDASGLDDVLPRGSALPAAWRPSSGLR